MLIKKALLAISVQIHSKVVQWVDVRALCGPVKFLLHAGKGTFPNCSHKVGSIALSKMSWYAEALRFPFNGRKWPRLTPEKQSQTIITSSTKHYSWHNAVRQVTFSWHSPNSDSPIRLPTREAWFVTPQNRLRVQWLHALQHSIHHVTLYLVMWVLYVNQLNQQSIDDFCAPCTSIAVPILWFRFRVAAVPFSSYNTYS